MEINVVSRLYVPVCYGCFTVSRLEVWLGTYLSSVVVVLCVFAMIVYRKRGPCQRPNINDSLSSQLSGSFSGLTCNILLNISVVSLEVI